MPLSAYFPPIDNRRYDDIVAEARTRIARYTPEWTDLNDNDPGITLVQLFAWMTDMMLYRLGRVPEQNYLKFIELLGMELTPAAPAVTEITFPILTSADEPVVIIPAHTQVAAEGGDSPLPVVFETDQSLVAVRAELAAVQAFDSYAYTDVTTLDADGATGYQPFGAVAPRHAALLIGFRDPQDFPQVQLNLAVFVQDEAMASVACGPRTVMPHASARIAWEYWAGTEWRTLALLKDETQAFMRSGHVFLKMPPAGSLVRGVIGEVTEPLFWIRGRLDQTSYEKVPALLAVRTNTAPATQAETARDEVLGGSDGRPNQRLRVGNAPVLSGTLRLEVDEGDGFAPWQEMEDFFGSGPRDRHYLLDRSSGEIRFGDGVQGAIPVGNVNNVTGNIVAREYRFGGGRRGNAAAGKVRSLLTSVPDVDQNAVTNLRAAVGGREEESLQSAMVRVPRAIRSRSRAVTADDFEYLAMQAASIRRAKALPLVHPGFPGVSVPGVVTVIVVPDGDAPNPTPSEGTLRNVCAYLDQARMLTTELYVVRPTYHLVHVRAELVADGNADLLEVKTSVEQALLDYFHPLRGGETGDGWPFGGDIYFSRVYQRVSLRGVQRIERLVISVDGCEAPDCTNVPVCEGHLVYSTGHEVSVSYDFGA